MGMIFSMPVGHEKFDYITVCKSEGKRLWYLGKLAVDYTLILKSIL